jgi:hypothetical protein
MHEYGSDRDFGVGLRFGRKLEGAAHVIDV